jgi:hypothetical protein
MRQPLILLLLSLTSNSLFACLSASQNRLFPLGQTVKGLCVVETHLYRTEFREKYKKAWGGISYFKIYDKNYKEIYSSILDTIRLFEQHYYDSIIGKTFKKGFELAKTYPDFVSSKPISITFCDYQKSCSKAELLFDTINNKVSIQLSNMIKYDINILFDSTSIASNLLNYFGGFDDADLSAKALVGNLYINSVRQFLIGNKKLTIVHIGSGQTFEFLEGGTYTAENEYKAKFAFTDISKSVFEEPVLHHGNGFDFFIWE